MKNKLKFMFIVAVFAIIFGFNESVSAQSLPIVGGFKNVAVTDKGVIDATNFALKTIAKEEEMDLKLDSIINAQQQVVQGMNYKILFKTSYSDGGEIYELCLNASVYRSLKKEYKLTSWDSVQCSEEE